MAREPQRSDQPRPVGAAIMPVQRALIARATALDDMVERSDATLAPVFAVIAAEYRNLAAELQHW